MPRVRKSFSRTSHRMRPVPRPKESQGVWENVLDNMVSTGVIASWEYMTIDEGYAPFVRVVFSGKKEVVTHHAAFCLLLQLMSKIKIHNYPGWLDSTEAESMRQEIETMANEKDYFEKLRYEFLKALFNMGGTPV